MALGDITPNRQTWLTLDCADYILSEAGIRAERTGAGIAKDKLNHQEVTDNIAGGGVGAAIADSRIWNMKYWTEGHWGLRPVQDEISNLQEYTSAVALIIGTSSFRWPSGAAGVGAWGAIDLWRQSTDLIGVTYGAGININGDKFMVKRITSGVTWSQTVTSAVTSPLGGELLIPLDRVAESTATYPADQGFFLRWTIPGTQKHQPGQIWTFYFGQYAVMLKGNGVAILWEYCQDDATPPVMQWRKRSVFRYCVTGRTADASHTLMIRPARNANGQRTISFQGGQPDAATAQAGFSLDSSTSPGTTSHVYVVDEISRNGDRDESPASTTKQEIIRFDCRRDLRPQIQISKLGYAPSGFLADLPFRLSDFQTSASVTIHISGTVPTGTTLSPVLIDTETGNLTTASTTSAQNYTFSIGTEVVRPGVIFNFSGNTNDTPRLYGYTFVRRPVALSGPATPFSLQPSQVSIEGLTSDYTEVGGSVIYDTDLTGANSILSRRGQFSALLWTKATIGTSTTTVNINLFRGYMVKPEGSKVGNTGEVYPNPEFYRYGLPLVGMHYRMTKRLHQGFMRSFAADPDVPPDARTGYTPYKVTTVIQELLLDAGFPISQINIGPGTYNDLDMRLWYGLSTNIADSQIEPMQSYGEMALRLCKDYLGATIYWNDQTGRWSLIFDPPKDNNGLYTPVFAFQLATDRQIAGLRDIAPVTDPHLWGNFASKTFIINEFHSRPVPPEWNAVSIYCPVKFGSNERDFVNVGATLRNFNSYKVPGSSVDPDPDHPDYLGTEFHIPIFDLACLGQGDNQGNIIQSTERNCQFKARRFFEFVCHGRQNYAFDAPLVFIQDTAYTIEGTATTTATFYRPLRYLDPVTVPYRGTPTTGLIRSCSPNYVQDQVQTARYEVVIPRTGC